ncbi:MAG TPA: ABC transporter permease [Rummeliibacillus sp.]|nr:ABC transporter permease [Rummeliibacillus sp.]
MSGDGLVWIILLLLLMLFDGTAIYLHKNNKLPLWLSGIIMGILTPILGFIIGALFLKLEEVVNPTSTREGAAFAAAFIVLVLMANSIVFFIVGIILKIINYFKAKEEVQQ